MRMNAKGTFCFEVSDPLTTDQCVQQRIALIAKNRDYAEGVREEIVEKGM